jgi:hypothetical protein
MMTHLAPNTIGRLRTPWPAPGGSNPLDEGAHSGDRFSDDERIHLASTFV